MRRRQTLPAWLVIFATALWLASCSDGEPSLESRAELARCLTQDGWLMYGSITCSACRAQRKGFGEAFAEINEIECNPNAPGTQVELCLKREIGPTPTWIREEDGEERERIEGYQLMEDLADLTGCPFD